MTNNTHDPLTIRADRIDDMVAQSRARALEARERVTELTPEEIEQVGGGAIVLRDYFPYGIIERRLADQFLSKPIIDQRLAGAAMTLKF